MRLSSTLGWAPVALAFAAFGCATLSEPEQEPPDEQYGHRHEGGTPGGRETIVITPPESDEAYFYYPAVIDSVHVRPAPFRPGAPADAQEVEVEVLIKGAFPDACTELHAVEQTRTGRLLEVTLETRRPRGAVCARAKRPYRFYMLLDGLYGLGSYTLRLNNEAYPFQVRAPQGGDA